MMLWNLTKGLRALVSEAGCGGSSKTPRTLTADAPKPLLSKTHQAAAQRLTDWPALKEVSYLNKVVKTSWEGAHPLMVLFYRDLNKELAARGFPFYAHCFLRSAEAQYDAFRRGASKARPGQSPHNYGCAVDIIHAKRGWDIDREQWEVIGAIGKEVARKRGIPVVWGGDFQSLWDPAHWELEYWRDLRTIHDRHGWPLNTFSDFAETEQLALQAGLTSKLWRKDDLGVIVGSELLEIVNRRFSRH